MLSGASHSATTIHQMGRVAGGCRGGVFGRGGGGSQGGGACARPTTTTCIPPRGMCVWGSWGTEVCIPGPDHLAQHHKQCVILMLLELMRDNSEGTG